MQATEKKEEYCKKIMGLDLEIIRKSPKIEENGIYQCSRCGFRHQVVAGPAFSDDQSINEENAKEQHQAYFVLCGGTPYVMAIDGHLIEDAEKQMAPMDRAKRVMGEVIHVFSSLDAVRIQLEQKIGLPVTVATGKESVGISFDLEYLRRVSSCLEDIADFLGIRADEDEEESLDLLVS